MSATSVLQAAQSLLQAAVPEATVLARAPVAVNDPVVLYLWHDSYVEDMKGGGNIRRTHVIPIHLMVLSSADDAQAEATLLDLTDRILDAFYQSKDARQLYGGAATSQLLPPPTGRPSYIVYQQGEYRHRQWTLHATEDVAYTWR